MTRTRRTIAAAALTGALAALALPAVAHGWSIHNWRIRDAGPEIVAKLTICVGRPATIRVRVHVEHEDGSDGRNGSLLGDSEAGCRRAQLVFDDNLRYRGWYYGRARVRVFDATPSVRYTGWRRFFSR